MFVPDRARLVAAVAGAAALQYQRPDPFGIAHMKGQGHETTQGMAADNRRFDAQMIQDRGHVLFRVALAVELRLQRTQAFAMAPHVHADQTVLFAEGVHLAAPHTGRGGEAMGQQDRRPITAAVFKMNTDAVAIQIWHCGTP